jgi:hypothetical protein
MNAASVLLAAGAAVCLAAASVLQQQAAGAVAPDAGVVRLLWRLVRTPRWLVGRGIDTLALVLQALALARGSFIAVQATITTSVVIALAMQHRRDRPVEPVRLAGAAAVVLGVVVLLAGGRPEGGQTAERASMWGVAVGAVAVLVALALAAARRATNAGAVAGMLAAVTGACFALDAAALKSLHGSPGRVVVFGLVFALAAFAGNVLVQRAFHIAPLHASLPVLTACAPIFGLFAGVLLFDERLRPGAGPRTLALLGLVLLAGGAAVAAGARTRILER